MTATPDRMQQAIRKMAAFNAAMRLMNDAARATEGRAADGAVTVQVDADGAATAVLLDDSFRSRLSGPLGTAVVEAYQAARLEQMMAGLTKVAELPRRLDDVPVTDADLVAATPAPVDLDELRRTLPPVHEVSAQLDEAIAGVRRIEEGGGPAATERPSVTGDRDVELVLDAGGGIVACAVSEAWQRSAPLGRLLDELNAPLQERRERR